MTETVEFSAQGNELRSPVQDGEELKARIARSEERGPARAVRSDTRVRLLAAALELFAQNGFEATTMRDLAAFCGIKAPAIYNHFASKELVLGQALLWAMHDFNAAVLASDNLAVANASPVDRLRRILARHINYQIQNPMIARAFDVLSANDVLARLGESEERAAVIDQLRLYLRTVSSLVGEILERQDPPRPSIRIVSHAITTMHDQISRWYVSRSDAQDIELLDTYWNLTRQMLRLT